MHLTMSSAEKRRTSVSQPCPCGPQQPVLAHLDAGVRALRAWPASSTDDDGLARAESVLASLEELLEEPRAAAALRAHGDDRILDVFLELADVYGSFERALLALKQSISWELQAGVQRRHAHGDIAATVAASLRARWRAEKELCRLAAAMRRVSRHATVLSDGDSVTAIVADAAAATAAASEAIFRRCAAMSPDVSAVASTLPWLARLRVASTPATDKGVPEMAASSRTLEARIGELESGSEKVFRNLLRTRVSLLNIRSSF